MDVSVTMTAEDFLEFMAWKKEQTYYAAKMTAKDTKVETLAKKSAGPSEGIKSAPER